MNRVSIAYCESEVKQPSITSTSRTPLYIGHVKRDHVSSNSLLRGARRRLISVAVVGGLGLCATAYAESSSTSSTIPSAGNDVKPGDTIIWRANRNILKPYDTTATATSTVPAVAEKNPSAADKAAAAAKIVGSVQAILDKDAQSIVPTSASASGLLTLQEANDALALANANLKSANADAYAASTSATASKTVTPGGTLAAAAEYVSQAQGTAAKNEITANQADDNSKAAQQALEAAKAAAAKTPSQSNKDALAKATSQEKDASDKAAAARRVEQAGEIYLQAAIQAMTAAADSSLLAAATPAPPSVFCAPAGSRFEVRSIVAATSSSPSGTGSTGKSSSGATESNTQIVRGVYPQNREFLHTKALPFPRPNGGISNTPTRDAPCGLGTKYPSYGTVYEFTGDEIKANALDREGFTWGGLVVPFKFYFKDKSIKTNSSVLAFVGYEGWFSGLSLAGVVGVGVGAASSSASSGTATTSTSSTSTLATYTFGTGVVATFGGTVKAGLMFGRDYQGNASTFPYENKTWMALSIGAGF